jgi:hypothetical protein
MKAVHPWFRPRPSGRGRVELIELLKMVTIAIPTVILMFLAYHSGDTGYFIVNFLTTVALVYTLYKILRHCFADPRQSYWKI